MTSDGIHTIKRSKCGCWVFMEMNKKQINDFGRMKKIIEYLYEVQNCCQDPNTTLQKILMVQNLLHIKTPEYNYMSTSRNRLQILLGHEPTLIELISDTNRRVGMMHTK